VLHACVRWQSSWKAFAGAEKMAGKRLCSLVKRGCQKDQADEYKDLLRGARYMCRKCGRAAAKAKCLCKPEKL